jgi:3-phenylpropionate/trans-cinnamate dioxygenase ferredoxin subunit
LSFVRVAEASEIGPGEMRKVDLGGEEVLVANVDGVFHAIGNRCTHRGGDLSAGRLEGRVVTCPRHGSRFDVTTGEALSGPKVLLLRLGTGDVPTYGLKVEGGSILLARTADR